MTVLSVLFGIYPKISFHIFPHPTHDFTFILYESFITLFTSVALCSFFCNLIVDTIVVYYSIYVRHLGNIIVVYKILW